MSCLNLHVPKNPVGKYIPLVVLLQMYIIYVEPYYGLHYFESVRQFLGPKILYGTVYFLVICHSIESAIAFLLCLKKGLPFCSSMKWIVSTFIFGGPTLAMLNKQKKHIA
ncbi:hypothetical protein POMI540_3348 [Schizosaccharomyces pombe]|uniref:Uncharacterized membrane protein C688.16 n=1 Tax=Schizosaccharomyces pombe (strain 972 / ATCC 24843) TaxID=284812 RepID=YKQP_SCHPO|nr:uncharacterized protein SPAC688.16 [Schizosaccharomyces pombe]C6Y4A4.1 RecName: Full=Uncharacterized membrane protein C688.16 [Schizosaccharomyces pombe 972h-]CBA11501.1 sequence orphan [Schizosaccharomyces pombe]|eukprot:NP_001343076.1 uncharacterized protein SPAC688.16 [Schizosaccharomyces pombe]